MSYVAASSGMTAGADQESYGSCDVHALVDNDVRPRWVKFCSLCDAWICDECRGDLIKRAKAMLIRRVRGR